ncbi:MAG: type II toxin-antitoxin system RelE/ParE family toxin [Bacteroidales bacterium]|nr:type II toxin-antitoxin system RelE/ParE family toxin [Bacteroidales bacterium]
MVKKREVVWTRNSEIQLQEILDFFNRRNKSSAYSQKLYKLFKSELNTAAKQPEIGIKTRLDGIRGIIVGDYILFYEIFDNKLLVLKVWDCRQDPDKLDIPK